MAGEYFDFDDREIIIKTAENGVIVRYLIHTLDTDEPCYQIKVYKNDNPKDLEYLFYDIAEYCEIVNEYALKFKVIKNEES
jgi:hypothetical protein